MSRLTARTETGHAYLVNVKPDEQEVDSPYKNTLQCILDCFERLAQYEDAEEQGRCVVLPCKVGDTVWYAPKWHDEAWDGLIEETSTVNGYTIITFYVDPDMRIEAEIKDFGKTVFLTRAEAEAAMKGAEHEIPQETRCD